MRALRGRLWGDPASPAPCLPPSLRCASHPPSFHRSTRPQGNPKSPERGFTEHMRVASVPKSPGMEIRLLPSGALGLREHLAGKECCPTSFCPRRPV